MLADGDYEGMCIDADEAGGGAMALSIVLVAGEHKGEVVELRATGVTGDPLDRLGSPCTLQVSAGVPAVRFD